MKKFEPILFFLVAVANLIPVFSGRFFTTMDGPSHLYNVNILSQLLFHGSSFNTYFRINPVPVPNWLSYIILLAFHTLLPAFMAEKLFIIAYLFGLVYSFRALVKTIEPDSSYLTFLIFPFSYNLLLTLGFYNFCLSFIVLFLAWRFWLQHKNNLTLRKALPLSILITSAYFTHLFAFFVLGLSLGLLLITDLFTIKGEMTGKIKTLLKRSAFILVCTIPSLLFLIIYYLKINPATGNSGMPNYTNAALWQQLLSLRPIECFSVLYEQPDVQWIAISLGVLFLAAFVLQVRVFIKHNVAAASENNQKTVWLALSLIFLLLLFLVPNTFSAGMMTDRIELLFFLLLIIWIAVQKIPITVIVAPLLIMLVFHFILVGYYVHSITYENQEAKEYEMIGKDIKSNKTVLPISYSSNWIGGHFSNYMGIDNPIIILNNYEADLQWFPVLWSIDSLPNLALGEQRQEGFCYWWKHNALNPAKKIDYVVLLQKQNARDSCFNRIDTILNENYKLIKTYPDAELYELDSDL